MCLLILSFGPQRRLPPPDGLLMAYQICRRLGKTLLISAHLR
ncbi:MAG: hypothetical protein ACKESB_02820 [Candidatus Hodgkinia cicadicola]